VVFVGRGEESAALGRVLSGACQGAGGVLVLRGEAGVGKTALLRHAEQVAGAMRIVRAAGVRSEAELSFAAVHQLLVPFLDAVGRLPGPQRNALSSAFGLAPGPPPDQLLVGIGALTTIADVARQQPVLCVIDDAQWLDRESVSALGFAARRLSADAVGMLFAVGDDEEQRAGTLTGLPELWLDGLPAGAGQDLLASVTGQQMHRSVSRQIVAATGGNPLALAQIGRGLSPAQLSGAAPLPEPLRLGRRLEGLLLRRVRALPPPAQTLLLLAAAEPAADLRLLWRSAALLGVSPGAAEAPGIEDIIRTGSDVSFLHPMMRSAVYYGATTSERRRVHEALAAASDAGLDPDRRAWHLAAAATGADEQAAGQLVLGADRARRQGGWARSAALLERAAALTPDPAKRAQRSLATVEARLNAGDAAGAAALAEQVQAQLDDPLARAQLRWLQGAVQHALGRPAEATGILLEAAEALYPLDRGLAREALLQAFEAALTAGQLASGPGTGDVLRAVRAVPGPSAGQATAADLALDGFAALEAGAEQAGVARLRQATALVARQFTGGDRLRDGFVTAAAAGELLDDAALHGICTRGLAQARSHGSAARVAFMLGLVGHAEALAGRFTAAEAAAGEARELAPVAGPAAARQVVTSKLTVLAWRGQEAAARQLAEAGLREFTQARLGFRVGLTKIALTVLELGLGNYQAALRHALSASADPLAKAELWPELVEAAARCGAAGTAAPWLGKLAVRARASGSDWALGMLLRSRALLTADAHAEELYLAAIDHLARSPVVPQLGRAYLLYGEWLRRRRRRRDARSALRSAQEILDGIGAEAFADRARKELLAAGGQARKRNPATRRELTPQELRIAGLAGEGASNVEIASQLYISANTVAYHLKKVFRKLGVSNRTALARALQAHRLGRCWLPVLAAGAGCGAGCGPGGVAGWHRGSPGRSCAAARVNPDATSHAAQSLSVMSWSGLWASGSGFWVRWK
jgi:DNA-binding CsgD family transcriptional regulator